jgi:hypothetical protein
VSFLSNIFGGASNNFTPQGTQAALQQTQTANTNYGQANTGLNTLAQALTAQMNGGGPNLANQELQNATGQNVANQAALMAGQRGASSNVGLLARQAAQQGASIQQTAAGQAAQNQLAQQLAAQGQLGSVLGTQGSLANQNYGVAQSAVTSGNQIGSQQAQQNAQMNQGLIGGVANAGMGLLGLADGGDVSQPPKIFGSNSGFGQQSSFGFNFVTGKKPKPAAPMGNTSDPTDANITGSNNQIGATAQPVTAGDNMDPNMLHVASGGNVPRTMNNGNLPFAPMDLRRGGKIAARAPQEKAQVSGNSLSNDKIPAMVSEGETVIDRETMQDPGPAGKMARALAKHIEGKKRK